MLVLSYPRATLCGSRVARLRELPKTMVSAALANNLRMVRIELQEGSRPQRTDEHEICGASVHSGVFIARIIS